MPTPTYDQELPSLESEEDKKLFIQFFLEAVKQEYESQKQGRAIYKDIPMIKIITPGSRDVMITRVTDQYKRRFPRHWELFEKQLDQQVDGTPLETVPFLTPSQIHELKYLNCLTLEQLAGMSDQAGQRFMGFHKLKQKAIDFLAVAAGNAPISQLRAELEERDVKMKVMQDQIAELVAANAALQAAKKLGL